MEFVRRVGFVGAGQLSPVHIEAVQALLRVDIVGICDIHPDQARRRAAAAGIEAYSSLEDLVSAGADSIHVLTPPHAHVDVAVTAMRLGCDVFIEKPMAVSTGGCDAIVAAAAETGRIATVDHMTLFNPQVRRALERVAAGEIGRVVSVDLLRGGEVPEYRGGPVPPYFRDGGFAFRDLGVHCLTLMEAFLGPIDDVRAEWQSLGGAPSLPFDEWRTLVRCRDGMGQFQLTWNVQPGQHLLVVQGTAGVIKLDLFSLSSTRRRNLPGPRAVERTVNAVTEGLGLLGATTLSAGRFAAGGVRPLQGVRDHIAAFYDCIERGVPVPVSLERAAEIVRWTEHVAAAADRDHIARVHALGAPAAGVDVLVTGASGMLGGAIVDRLLGEGHSVRAFVRRVPTGPVAGVDYVVGNLGDSAATRRAVAGARIVVHAAATMRGRPSDFDAGTVTATANVVDACIDAGVDQLVHISSLGVVDHVAADGGRPTDETSPLEVEPAKRGRYTSSKLAAEDIVRRAVRDRALAAAVIRPGMIYRTVGDLLTGGVAHAVGRRWFVLGDGEARVPLVSLADVVESVVRTIRAGLHEGEIIHVVERDAPTRNELLGSLGDGRRIVHIPAGVLGTVGRVSDRVQRWTGRSSPVSARRLLSASARVTHGGFNAAKLLDWEPACSGPGRGDAS